MHCFLVSNMYPTHAYPGYGSFVKNVCEGLESYDIHTTYKAVIRGKAKTGIGKLFKYLCFYLNIITYYFKSYDFLYLHFPNHAIPILNVLIRIRKRRIIINFHGEDLLYEPKGISRRLGRMMENFTRKYASAIIVPSSYFRDIVIKRAYIAPENIIVSPSGGINPSIFYPGEKRLSNTFELGYVGRIEREKGIWEAIYSYERILRKHPVRLTIIGYGSCYAELLDYISARQLTDKVRVIPGIPQQQLGEYYRTMDLFLFGSHRTSESLGLTGLEAMACGVPVIGSDIGGVSTYVCNGRNGYLITPQSVDEMTNFIEEYISLSDIEKQQMRNACIETSKQYLTPFVIQVLSQKIFKVLNNYHT